MRAAFLILDAGHSEGDGSALYGLVLHFLLSHVDSIKHFLGLDLLDHDLAHIDWPGRYGLLHRLDHDVVLALSASAVQSLGEHRFLKDLVGIAPLSLHPSAELSWHRHLDSEDSSISWAETFDRVLVIN